MHELSPAEVIGGQLSAYNERDLDAFMGFWASDAVIKRWPDHLLAAGSDAIRMLHAERFAQPHLHAVSLSRLALGSLVIDREMVTRSERDQPALFEVVAIYEVISSRIRSATFQSLPLDHPSKPELA